MVDLKAVIHDDDSMPDPFQTLPDIASTGQVMVNQADLACHVKPLRTSIICSLTSRKGSTLSKPILKDNLVDDIAAQDATPTEEVFAGSREFLVDHDSPTTMALHNSLLDLSFMKRISNNHTIRWQSL